MSRKVAVNWIETIERSAVFLVPDGVSDDRVVAAIYDRIGGHWIEACFDDDSCTSEVVIEQGNLPTEETPVSASLRFPETK